MAGHFGSMWLPFPEPAQNALRHLFSIIWCCSQGVILYWWWNKAPPPPEKVWLPRDHPECAGESEAEDRFPDSKPNSTDSLHSANHAPLLWDPRGSLDQYENPLTVWRWGENKMWTFQVQSLFPTGKMRHLVHNLKRWLLRDLGQWVTFLNPPFSNL